MCLKIIKLRLQPHRPGANELSHGYVFVTSKYDYVVYLQRVTTHNTTADPDCTYDSQLQDHCINIQTIKHISTK